MPMTQPMMSKPISGAHVTVQVTPVPEDVRRTVGRVVERGIRDARREKVVFATPGVLEALDEALDEVAALRDGR